jgi:hypothetical protein
MKWLKLVKQKMDLVLKEIPNQNSVGFNLIMNFNLRKQNKFKLLPMRTFLIKLERKGKKKMILKFNSRDKIKFKRQHKSKLNLEMI